MQVLFIVDRNQEHNDNHERLPQAFKSAGWEVFVEFWDALYSSSSGPGMGSTDQGELDLIWPVGLGPHASFIDRIQILCEFPAESFITRPTAWLTHHGKAAWLRYAPETHVAPVAQLADFLREQAGNWVVKPNAGSFGRDVTRVTNVPELVAATSGAPDHWWVLQRYVPEIESGETRTLICRDEVLGSYLRVPSDGFKANLAADAELQLTELDECARHIVAQTHQMLQDRGIGYAAIDTAGGYLVEVNIANPGGLSSLEALGDHTIYERLVRAVARSF